MGEPVEIGLELYSRFEQPILVSRLQGNEFVKFKLVGPDGSEIRWQERAGERTHAYKASDFTTLGQYQAVSASRTISLQDGTGFSLNKPGEYTLIAEFSMARGENLAPFESQAKAAKGSFRSSKLVFCIEACILTTVPVHTDAPRSALETVRMFYTQLSKYDREYGSSGIPSGRSKRAIRPLMSKRLAQEIDALDACDKDYFQRYGEILRARTWKAAIPWGEAGLFTGPDDAADGAEFRVLGSRSVGQNRVDALLAFKQDWGESQGDVTVILEKGRWVVDDYVSMYGNDDLVRLSAGYSQCKDGRWVGGP